MTLTDQPARRIFRAEVMAVIFALVVQGAGMVWWGSNINSRVAALEVKTTTYAHVAEDVARIDERTAGIKDSLQRIEARLDDNRSNP